MASKIRSYYKNASGSGMLEFALIVPLMLTLSFGAIEFTRVFSDRQKLSTLSANAADRAFRVCADSTTAGSCLDLHAADAGASAALALPGAKITLSVYQRDPAGVVSQVGIRCVDSLYPNNVVSGCPSNYNASSPALLRLISATSAIGPNNPNVAIAEVSYVHRQITPMIPWISTFMPGQLYEATIY